MAARMRNLPLKTSQIFTGLKRRNVSRLYTQIQRSKSVATTVNGDFKKWKDAKKPIDSAAESHKNAVNELDLSFTNGSEAYKSRTNYELFRALLVFRMCGFESLVQHNKAVSSRD